MWPFINTGNKTSLQNDRSYELNAFYTLKYNNPGLSPHKMTKYIQIIILYILKI